MPGRIRTLKFSRAFPLLVVLLTLTVYGVTVVVFTRHLHESLRGQLLNREGDTLHAVALMDQQGGQFETEILGSIEEPLVQEEIALRTSRLKSVLAYRLFDASGQFHNAFPPEVREARLAPEALHRLRRLQPVTRFRPQGDLADIFLTESRNQPTIPLIEIHVPFHRIDGDQLYGVAQFLVDGAGMAEALQAMESRLYRQAWLIFLIGGAMVTAALSWAFHRLQYVNRQLEDRRRELMRVNRELADTARTSAVGAISAHLIHGLINPLSGLQSFLSSRDENGEVVDEDDWREALQAAHRMRTMVHDIVEVIRDEGNPTTGSLTLKEISGVVESKLAPEALKRGVEFEVVNEADATLTCRAANLVTLILVNLMENALEASPTGSRVRLLFRRLNGRIEARVEDRGHGIPEHERELLFQPRRSTKPGGNGIGLAISKQLAQHLEASLQLQQSSPAGSTFALTLPESLLDDNRTEPEPPPTLSPGTSKARA